MRGERERVAALVGVSNDLTSGITGYRDLCKPPFTRLVE
jgi:hypothetical protein